MAYNFISGKTKLEALKARLLAQKAQGAVIEPKQWFTEEELTWDYWINVVQGCIDDDLVMDEYDYHNSPKEIKACWKGLKDKDPMMEDVYA